MRLSCFLSVLLCLAVGCSTSDSTRRTEPRQALGEVQVRDAASGELTVAPGQCRSGEPLLFLGADFIAERLTTRLILSPEGEASIRIFDPATPLERGLLFGREQCRELEISLERTGWQINDIHDLRVALRFDCSSDAGAASGSLSATGCH